MKNIIILLLISFAAQAQNSVFKSLQKGDFIYSYDSTQMNDYPYSRGSESAKKLINSNNTIRYATQLYDGTMYFESALSAANVLDTLSASGITGFCRITIPTSVTTQRIINYENNAIIFSTANYRLVAADTNFLTFPLQIFRISDNKLMVTIKEFGRWDWNVQPQWSWLGRVGTTRLKRITLP